MQQAKVELVRRLRPLPDGDLAVRFRGDGAAGPLAQVFAAFSHTGCEFSAA